MVADGGRGRVALISGPALDLLLLACCCLLIHGSQDDYETLYYRRGKNTKSIPRKSTALRICPGRQCLEGLGQTRYDIDARHIIHENVMRYEQMVL